MIMIRGKFSNTKMNYTGSVRKVGDLTISSYLSSLINITFA